MSTPSIELKIPVGPVANANRALAESLNLIQQATEQGARLFAADRIGQAIRLRDAAVAKRKGGEWDEAARLANDAKAAAEEALASALAQRIPPRRRCSATAGARSRASVRRTCCGPTG